MRKAVFIFSICFFIVCSSCQKEYDCVCTNVSTGEKIYRDKVKTTKLGKKGFEKSCKSNNDTIRELKDCRIE
ncbi:MAG: hypothetical protein H7141_14230 [Burkholderiales bacterium]|nr:hypothetical protein [Bacteroidia bacterium]